MSKKKKPAFPPPVHINGRVYFQRSLLDKYKYAVLAKALDGELEIPPSPHEEFVPATQAARELGVTRRTIGRRVAEFDKEKRLSDELAVASGKRLAKGRDEANALKIADDLEKARDNYNRAA